MEQLVVPLKSGEQVTITIAPEQNRQDAIASASDAASNLEARVQLMEGYSYEYEIQNRPDLGLRADAKTVRQFKSRPNIGRITPGNYVGTLAIEVVNGDLVQGVFDVEIRSYKSSYREDYRHMLNYITEQCAEIVLQHSSPVTQNLTYNYDGDAQTLYQRFAFVRSVIESEEFEESVHRVITMPVNSWLDREEEIDTRRAGRLGASAVKAFSKGSNRLELPNGPIKSALGISSIPVTVPRRKRFETVDTPENRFVLFALSSFQQFCADIGIKLLEKGSTKEAGHAEQVVDRLEEWLGHSMFKEVGRPTTIPLNSPVLQRKEGYREVLRAWLMFDLAAKLVWQAGDDIYKAGKRDVAKLYEYWVFFKLLDVLSKKFNLESRSIEELIKKTDDGLSLNLIEGQHTAINGVYQRKSRLLRVKFSFNRSFSGKRDYPSGGSWTKQMRPDYTLTVWPAQLTEEEAEEAELIVHIHFDAKYKIDKVKRWLESEDDQEEKEETVVGSFKRVDLLKMHAYKDAIRRTGGAYVLYPGEEGWSREGFHEVLPGLGAFPLRPSSVNDGSKDLLEFIDKVISHLLNRATQREKASYYNYRVHRSGPSDSLHEPVPEFYGGERTAPVDETSVLVGFYHQAQLEWIEKNGYYNTRTGKRNGSIDLGPMETGAQYLLLHGNNELVTARLYRIVGHREGKSGPRIWSAEEMEDRGYPISETSSRYYAVYKIDAQVPAELRDMEFDVRKLAGYTSGRSSSLPFAVTLKQLLQAVHKH